MNANIATHFMAVPSDDRLVEMRNKRKTASGGRKEEATARGRAENSINSMEGKVGVGVKKSSTCRNKLLYLGLHIYGAFRLLEGSV